jgi:hypothetical protein
MDTPDTALNGQNMTAGGRLYMAFELGETDWKLSLGDCQRALSAVQSPPAMPRRPSPIPRRVAISVPTHPSTSVMKQAATVSDCTAGWLNGTSSISWWIWSVSR